MVNTTPIPVISLVVTDETIQRFSIRIQYNLETYLDLYSYFIQNYQSLITNYFQQTNVRPDANAFKFLDQLLQESVKIDNLIKNNRTSFDKYDDWELLDFIEDVRMKLETIDNTYKYTRSSKTKNSWRITGITVDHIMGQDETIETIIQNELQSQNPQDDWTGLAIANNLFETDYDTDGGNDIVIQKGATYALNVVLNSIIDVLQGVTLYGLDFQNKLQFVNNDLKILSYVQTFIQAVTTLSTFKQGDAPEFPKMGIDPKLSVGANSNVFDFGSLIRQLNQVFATDDTIQNFAVQGFNYSNADVFLKYQADSYYNAIYKNQVKVNN